MRVLMVNQYVVVPGAPGGTRHFSLARELVRRGHAVTIAATSFEHMTRTDRRLRPGESHRREEIEGVEFLWLRTPPYGGNTVARLWNMAVFAAKVARLKAAGLVERPDVIIGSSPHPFAALAALRLAERYQIPFLLEVRDLWPQTLMDLGQMGAHHPLIMIMGWIERQLYRRSQRILSLLPGAADHMVAKGADPARVIWLPNGVDFDLVPPPAPHQNPLFTLIYAGSHGLSNQLDTLLDAATLLEDDPQWQGRVRLRLVGDGPDKARLMDRAVREGLKSVSFEPPVPKERVFPLLQEADACVLTTQDSPLYRWGISPNKLYDYLAAGRPVIIGCNAPYRPVTEAGAGYTIPPANPAAMAAAIQALASATADERTAMGQLGRAYALERHSFTALGQRLEALLLDCLREHGARPASAGAEALS